VKDRQTIMQLKQTINGNTCHNIQSCQSPTARNSASKKKNDGPNNVCNDEVQNAKKVPILSSQKIWEIIL